MDMRKENYLTRIEEGMTVVDSNNDKIGKVDYVQFGDEDPTEPGAETHTSPRDFDYNDTWVREIAEVLSGEDDIPEAVKARFFRYGYIKIDKGFFSSDRYAVLDSVSAVDGDTIRLNIDKDDLFSS